jgi:GTPase SAR1 family protein
MSKRDHYNLREKYTRFRILVIGRANAGKTTLLQRVCNTTEDPCIYDENNKNLVSIHRTEDEYLYLTFSTKLEPTSAVLHFLIDIYQLCLTPTHTARDT